MSVSYSSCLPCYCPRSQTGRSQRSGFAAHMCASGHIKIFQQASFGTQTWEKSRAGAKACRVSREEIERKKTLTLFSFPSPWRMPPGTPLYSPEAHVLSGDI